jgi:hypothetical protein
MKSFEPARLVEKRPHHGTRQVITRAVVGERPNRRLNLAPLIVFLGRDQRAGEMQRHA